MALPLVTRLVRQVESGAKRLAPRGDHRHGSGKPRRTRALVPSIHSKVTVLAWGIRGEVGSNAVHAATVHLGSKPHIIRARGKMLKFTSDRIDFASAARRGRRGGNKRMGRFHYRFSVLHPGNKRPVRYLTTPLVQFGHAAGFRVVLHTVQVSSHLP
jgi:hypothetical protein